MEYFSGVSDVLSEGSAGNFKRKIYEICVTPPPSVLCLSKIIYRIDFHSDENESTQHNLNNANLTIHVEDFFALIFAFTRIQTKSTHVPQHPDELLLWKLNYPTTI